MPLTDADREKAHRNSPIARQKQLMHRVRRAHALYDGGDGMTENEIAIALGVKPRTVMKYLKTKLEC